MLFPRIDLTAPGPLLVTGVPEGLDAWLLAEIIANAPGRQILHVARDDARMARLAESLAFIAPTVERLLMPAWDCLPYDRVSPHRGVVSQRLETLLRLSESPSPGPRGRFVLTTVNALLQRVVAPEDLAGARLEVGVDDRIGRETFLKYFERNGYGRAAAVIEPGEYAVRGGIIDVYPALGEVPLRIDQFGDRVEGIRVFDPIDQRSKGKARHVVLTPMSEVVMEAESIARFRAGYHHNFGAVTEEDPLYETVVAGKRHIGMEHWMPLFCSRMQTIFDYLPRAVVTLEPLVDEARDDRLHTIGDHYQARLENAAEPRHSAGSVYRPLPPQSLYLSGAEWEQHLTRAIRLSPFHEVAGAGVVEVGGRMAPDFAAQRGDGNVFDAVRDYATARRAEGKAVHIACVSEGSRDRLTRLLHDHGLERLAKIDAWCSAADLAAGVVGIFVLGLERGFEAGGLVVLGEQDILGKRLAQPSAKRRRSAAAAVEVSDLSVSDLVVHKDHGVGRYDGLATLDHGEVQHDCVRLIYAGDDKLFVPVINIDTLSRYGSADGAIQLDRLGTAHWQARKASLKKRIHDMAAELLRVAAARRLRPASVVTPPSGLYDEFCARFPYVETDDQLRAIEDVLLDLESGRAMERLICGDVGFGKTEVALRAAFATAMAGEQVAVVVPTTLLCRQHHATFTSRFADFPVRIEQLSRLVSGKRAKEVKAGLRDGRVDIVIGTHALLGKSIKFKNLGLVAIDEEQHFGVGHKERLKQLRTDAHVLTMTATPIPRTLQMALSGLREMSVIATPPIDRLAVRTFVTPYDPLVVREAILRESFRDGQSFVVCPRIEDLERVVPRLRELVPEVKVTCAHGKLPPATLETVMHEFYDGKYDVLVSTAIIESGLDLPRVNTLIVHRADMFGLAQLYQLRGRIGRAKLRAYAYLTLPRRGPYSATAAKRLQAMQRLDTLGAGFNLASYDLDIRGAGNLLGAEQSGHIREVGFELYQHMLEETVAEARAESEGAIPATTESWSPRIDVGASVLIPESFVADLDVRMGLYRRLAALEEGEEIEAFAAEMVDRFGHLPEAVENLLAVMALKRLCRLAGVENVDAGANGAVISFRANRFANPSGLVEFLARQSVSARLRPDHKLVLMRDWSRLDRRLSELSKALRTLSDIARSGEAACR